MKLYIADITNPFSTIVNTTYVERDGGSGYL